MASRDGEDIIVGNQTFLLERGIQPTQTSGAGVGSEVFVARSGRFLGTLQIADTLRPDEEG
jgi:cation transport ATPase